jgi:hypothetical protein
MMGLLNVLLMSKRFSFDRCCSAGQISKSINYCSSTCSLIDKIVVTISVSLTYLKAHERVEERSYEVFYASPFNVD